jgi:adenine phosphoribosyltransferase
MSIDLAAHIRDVPDFPKPGILFKDIMPLLQDPKAFAAAVEALAAPYRERPPDLIVAVEARGFIFAGAVAVELDCGFVPMRKPGKLPAETVKLEYELEYGTDAIEVHRDAIGPDTRVVVMDDLLATGGTAAAAARLVEQLGGSVEGISFLIELDFLKGRARLGDHPVHTVIHFD